MTEVETEAEDGVEGRGLQEQREGEVWDLGGQEQEGREGREGREGQEGQEEKATIEQISNFVGERGREGKGEGGEEVVDGGGAWTVPMHGFDAQIRAENDACEGVMAERDSLVREVEVCAHACTCACMYPRTCAPTNPAHTQT